MECGIAPPLVSFMRTVWPWRTWTIGPGTPPSKPQAANFTPGAISTVTSLMTMCTLATLPGATGGSSAGYGLWAAASSSALSGFAPAKLVREPEAAA